KTASVAASKRASTPRCCHAPSWTGNSCNGRRSTCASPARSHTLINAPPASRNTNNAQNCQRAVLIASHHRLIRTAHRQCRLRCRILDGRLALNFISIYRCLHTQRLRPSLSLRVVFAFPLAPRAQVEQPADREQQQEGDDIDDPTGKRMKETISDTSAGEAREHS